MIGLIMAGIFHGMAHDVAMVEGVARVERDVPVRVAPLPVMVICRQALLGLERIENALDDREWRDPRSLLRRSYHGGQSRDDQRKPQRRNR